MHLNYGLRASVVILTFFLSAGGAGARDWPDEPQTPPENKVQWVGKHEISKLANFTLEDGSLIVQFTPPEEWAKADAVRTDIVGSSARWTWKYTPAKTLSNGTVLSDRVVQVWYRDTGDEQKDGHVKAVVQCKGDRVLINGTVRRGRETISISYRSRPEPDGVELEMYLQENNEMTQQVLDARGSSLEAIRAEHQLEVDQLLAPMLQKLGQKNVMSLGAGDVYRLFDAIPAEPTAAQKLSQLLPQLDSESVRERQQATEEMKKLGRSGVLAAMRQDVAVLSPEQRARLERFVEAHQRRMITDLGQARKNLSLLMECLEDEDPAVRAQAKQAIEGLLGHAVVFDPKQGFEQRQTDLRQLRETLEEQIGQSSAMYVPVRGGF